jgi:hypothetical protein
MYRHRGKPSERFVAGTGEIRVDAGAKSPTIEQALVSGSGRGAIGRRIRPGGATTWYFDASHAGPKLFGGIVPEVELKRGGKWMLELGEGSLRLRTVLPPSDGHQVELEARLDLREPANAAVARALLSRPSPARARALGVHIAEHGTVERREYRVRKLPAEGGVSLQMGVAGVDHSGSVQERTLVAADVLRPGSRARRADCLGL